MNRKKKNDGGSDDYIDSQGKAEVLAEVLTTKEVTEPEISELSLIHI